MTDTSSSPTGHFPPPAELDSREMQLDPFPWFKTMRQQAPVRYDETRACWEVFTYDTVTEVYSNWEVFSSRGPVPMDRQNLIRDSIFNVDPPRHTKLRSKITDSFQRETIVQHEPEIRSIAETLLETAPTDGRIDIVEDFAQPLPTVVLAKLLGVPDEDLDQFRNWCTVLTKQQPGSTSDAVAEQQRVGTEMTEYFTRIIERRRDDPQDDIISTLSRSEIDGEPMPTDDVLGFCVLLLLAGITTTAHAITNAVRCFSSHDLLTELAGDDDRIRTAMEEVYRYRPPVPVNRRVVTEATELAGKQLRKGDLVLLWISSANRDAAQFDDPDTFDPDRNPNPHISFGHGIHRCLGNTLARLDGRIAISTLLDKEIRVVDQELSPVWATSLHGVNQLEVEISS